MGCAILATGQTWCWGFNGRAQLGRPTSGTLGAPALTPLSGLKPVRTAHGSYTSFAVTDQGDVVSWGTVGGPRANLSGRTSSTELDPNPLPIGLDDVTKLAVSSSTEFQPPGYPQPPLRVYGHACAVVKGEVYCWGLSEYASLGTGSPDLALKPTKIGMNTGQAWAQQVAVGERDDVRPPHRRERAVRRRQSPRRARHRRRRGSEVLDGVQARNGARRARRGHRGDSFDDLRAAEDRRSRLLGRQRRRPARTGNEGRRDARNSRHRETLRGSAMSSSDCPSRCPACASESLAGVVAVAACSAAADRDLAAPRHASETRARPMVSRRLRLFIARAISRSLHWLRGWPRRSLPMRARTRVAASTSASTHARRPSSRRAPPAARSGPFRPTMSCTATASASRR